MNPKISPNTTLVTLCSTQLHTSHQQLHTTPPHCRYIQHSATHIQPKTLPHSTLLPPYTALSYTNSTNTYTLLYITTAIYITQLHTFNQHLHLISHYYSYIEHSVTHIQPATTPHSTSLPYSGIQHSVTHIQPTPTLHSILLPLYTALSYTHPINTYTLFHHTTAIYSTQLHTSHQHLHFTPYYYRYIEHSVTRIQPTPTLHSTWLPLYTALSYTHPTNTYTSLHLTTAIYNTQLHTSH